MAKSLDFLIVGCGLAGAILAFQLIRRGRRVLIVDSQDVGASQVAAGLINPITGIRFAKTEAVDQLLPEALSFYSELAKIFKRDFFISKTIHRLLVDVNAADVCRERLKNPGYLPFVSGITESAEYPGYYGYAEQKQAGYLAIKPLLASLKEMFCNSAAYQHCRFDYSDLRLKPKLQWQEYQPQAVVFCEGSMMTGNQWFSNLPLRPVKGEILTLKAAISLPAQILIDRYWLLPETHGYVRVGATFERDFADSAVTEQAQKKLLSAAGHMLPVLEKSEIVEHVAGIRPCTEDRQPFIGTHPVLSKLHVFNGFGTKGSLQIPWYSRRFVDYLLTGATLPSTADIKRYELAIFSGC